MTGLSLGFPVRNKGAGMHVGRDRSWILSIAISVALSTFGLSGCSSAQPNASRSQALIQASRKGDVHRVENLIRAGADINAVDAEGWTPYLAASSEGNWAVMKVLEKNGCKKDPGF
jgi:ankyrin repeat protein